jgi:hypothetical protein
VIRIPPRVLYPIAIKPTHSRAQVCSPAPPLVYSLPAIPPCTARDHQQPSSRRSISALGDSLSDTIPPPRIGILAGRNLHVCAITKATSSSSSHCRHRLPGDPSVPQSLSLSRSLLALSVLRTEFVPPSLPRPSSRGLSFANSIPLIMQSSQISVISS